MLSELQNIHHPEHDSWDTLLEGAYMEEYFSRLREHMRADFERYQFLVINHNMKRSFPDLHVAGPNTVLVWLSDETSHVPEDLASRFRLILKSYWPREQPLGNIHPFPLCGSSEVVRHEVVPFELRSTNVFFSGNLNANRLGLYGTFACIPLAGMLDRLPGRARLLLLKAFRINLLRTRRDFSNTFPSSSVTFTDGFRKGASPADFADLLANTKIAICPHGFTSPECIRHFEAMKLGCVVVSCKLPPNHFYQGSPVIQLNHWGLLKPAINCLLTQPLELESLSSKTLAWWEKTCSPEVMAAYTAELLLSNTP